MLHTTSRRLAATAAATAIGAAALVAVTAPAASAATVSTVYTCTFSPPLGNRDIPVSVTAALPAAAPAGLDAPALPVMLTVTLPAEVVDVARSPAFGATSLGGFSNDMSASLTEGTSTTSSADLPFEKVKFPQTQLPALPGSPLTLSTPLATTPETATTKPTDLPDAGTYNVNLPAAFNFTATKQGEATLLADLPCVLKAGATSTAGTITLAKNDSTTTGKTAKKVTPVGKKAKVKVVVDADNEVPSGVVKVLKGKKVLGKATLSKTGKASIKLKKVLPAGVTNVKVSYAGDGFTELSKSKKIKVRVG